MPLGNGDSFQTATTAPSVIQKREQWLEFPIEEMPLLLFLKQILQYKWCWEEIFLLKPVLTSPLFFLIRLETPYRTLKKEFLLQDDLKNNASRFLLTWLKQACPSAKLDKEDF